jgi:HAE1 family hydrophobic/amphiphilic exporter-1
MANSEKPIKVSVYGKNLATLKEITDALSAAIKTVPGLKDVESSFSRGRPEFHFTIDRQKAFSFGLAPAQIQAALEAANLGKVVTSFRTGNEEIDIRVILDDRYRESMEWISTIPLKTATGRIIPLGQFVSIERKDGPATISRDSKYRVGTVDANLSGIALGAAVLEVKKKIEHIEKTLPEGYTIEFKGQYENMKDASIQLMVAFMIAVLLVFMVMAISFESLVQPLVVMFTVPLSVIGVILALLLSGRPFSIVAFVSVIILVGVVTNNGIVLIDYVNRLRRTGMSVKDALIEGGKTRVRPILITAGTTIFGAVPLAFSRGDGAEINNPLALVLIGGLASSTFLTLFILPIVYMYFDRLGQAIKNGVKRFIG